MQQLHFLPYGNCNILVVKYNFFLLDQQNQFNMHLNKNKQA